MSKTWGLAPTLIVLAGCAGSVDTAPSTGGSIVVKAAQARAGVITFARSDLQEASRIAHEDGDRIASQCWDYLITVVPEEGEAGNSNGKIDGVATAFQRARGLVKRVGDGVSDDLRLNCGPLYLDAKDDVSGIAGRIAALAAKFGVKGFLPL